MRQERVRERMNARVTKPSSYILRGGREMAAKAMAKGKTAAKGKPAMKAKPAAKAKAAAKTVAAKPKTVAKKAVAAKPQAAPSMPAGQGDNMMENS
jgi:hypothetical protein